jgi:lysophospholipase L1-like esterase
MKWISTWAASPQLSQPENLPPPPFSRGGLAFADSTIRQTIRVTLGGRRMRLWLNNRFGATDLSVTAASVARPRGGRQGDHAIQPGSCRQLTFDGQPGTDLAPAAERACDPVDLDVAPGSCVTVTMYLGPGQPGAAITSHPGSRTTSWAAAGNHVGDEDLAGAVPVDHWYFLGSVETWCRGDTAAIVILGDSLTDGRGSTTNGDDRWPDRLFARLQSSHATSGVAVLNQGIGGNRVLSEGTSPSARSRLEHDVLSYGSVRWLIVFEGVNDIGAAAATKIDLQNVSDALIGAYRSMISQSKPFGIKVLGATLTPFGGHAGYDDPLGHREATRQAVNEWIRSGESFDGVLDFDQAVRDPASPRHLLPRCDSGDRLHLSPAGYQALADAVPVSLFRAR